MRRVLVVCLSLLCSAVAQQASPASNSSPATVTVPAGTPIEPASADTTTPTFVAHSRLVVVPVVVTAHGKPVTGLKQSDFSIRENGKERKIAVFEEIKADSTPVKPLRKAASGSKEFSNLQVDQSTPKRLVIIALDMINTPLHDRVYARQQLVKFLSSGIDSDTLVSLVAIGSGRVQVIHDFTSDPDALIAVLNRASGLPHPGAPPESRPRSSSEERVFQNEVNRIEALLDTGTFSGGRFFGNTGWTRQMRVRQTLDSLNQIAQAYAAVPGRKSLIWATSGFPFSSDSDILDDYHHTSEVMNNANVALYPVDLRGLVAISIGADENARPQDINRIMHAKLVKEMRTIDTFGAFAQMTGGRAFYNTNNLADSFEKASEDSAAYYMLAYYLENDGTKSDWRKLKVTVDAPGAAVRARSGFFVGGKADSDAFAKDEIDLAVASPLDFTALPVTVRWLEQVKDPAQSEKKIGFEVFVPPDRITIDAADSNHLSLRVVANVRTTSASPVTGISQSIEGNLTPETLRKLKINGFLFKSSISLPPGRYSVRFVVRDNLAQRIGSVAAPLVVGY